MPTPDAIKETRQLTVKLSPEELQEREKSHRACLDEQDVLKAEKKDLVAGINVKLKAADARERILRHTLAEGSEIRDVECVVEKDFEAARIAVVRLDTQVVVEARPMTWEEKQVTLFDANKMLPPSEEPAPASAGEDDPVVTAALEELEGKPTNNVFPIISKDRTPDRPRTPEEEAEDRAAEEKAAQLVQSGNTSAPVVPEARAPRTRRARPTPATE